MHVTPHQRVGDVTHPAVERQSIQQQFVRSEREFQLFALLRALSLPLLVNVAVLAVGCGSSPTLNVTRLEERVGSGYEREINGNLRRVGNDARARVVKTDCVVNHDQDHATCLAKLGGALRGRASLSVDIGQDGELIWKVDTDDVSAAPVRPKPVEFTSPTGNITCSLLDDRAECVVLSEKRTYVVRSGRRAEARPENIELASRTGELDPLEYGRSRQRGDISCRSSSEGMTCVDGDGHGFTLSRSSQLLF